MLERDLLNVIREFEEEGDSILKNAENTVKQMKEMQKKKMLDLRNELEESLKKEVENYKNTQLKNLQEELKKFKEHFDNDLKNLEVSSQSKLEELVLKYSKEVLNYGNRES